MTSAKDMEVFIVDDTSVSRALICAALDECGLFKRRFARNGEEALKALMVQPAPLVISDMQMPKMNGLGLLKALREYKPTSRVGFILVSGQKDHSVIAEGRRYGLNNFLAKPFDGPAMKRCIEAVVGKLQ